MVLRLDMKKLVCLLAVFICCICSTALAGSHLNLQGVFTSAPDNRSLSLDLYEQDGETIIVSPLFPSYALSLGNGEHPLGLSSLYPLFLSDTGTISFLDRYIGEVLRSWFDERCGEPCTGFYDGDLFTGAHKMTACEFTLSDLLLYLHHTLQEPSVNGTPAEDRLQGAVSCCSGLLSYIENDISSNQISVLTKCFDDGVFYTINVRKGNTDILSLSADLTDTNHRRFLTVWEENQKTYLNDIQLADSAGQFRIISALYSGTGSSFQKASEQEPLYCESFTISDSGKMQGDFTYSLEAAAFVHPLTITGQRICMSDGSFRIRATAEITDSPDSILDLDCVFEETNRNISFSDLSTVDVFNDKESAAAGLEFMSSLTLLAAEIIPTLPLSYQQKLLTVFFSK